MKQTWLTLLAFCLPLISLQAEETIIDNGTKVSFPRDVSFDYEGKEYKLEATGVATRKKLIVKVYSIAHYLQQDALKQGQDKMEAILSDQFAKQFSMKWVRDVTATQQQDGFKESLHKVLSKEDYAQLDSDINTFLQFFNQDAHKGDEYVLRWIPGGHLEVDINKKKAGTITKPELVKAVWNIWFGNTGVVNRNDLTSLL